MDNEEAKLKILAHAVYELRQLLSSHIGPAVKDNICEAASANLVYALHNEALAIIENRPQEFNVHDAIRKIKGMEEMIGDKYSGQFQELINEIEA